MEAAITPTPHTATTTVARSFTIAVSLEVILYIGIVFIGLGLRLVALGDTPLSGAEAHEALAALRHTDHRINGEPIVANYPLMQATNQVVFFLFNSTTFAARFPTALVGTLLVALPWLWRPFIGRVPALALAILLATSPVTLTAARTMSGITWTMAIVFIGGWCVYRFIETRQAGFSVGATMSAVALLLLTEPTGLITFIGVGSGLALGLFLTTDDEKPSNIRKLFRETFTQWSWGEGIIASFGLVVLVGTVFFTSGASLTSVGNTLAQFAEGFSKRIDGKPSAFGLWVALRYDLGIVLFGILGMFFALSEGKFRDHFFAGWFMWSLLVTPLYAGVTADAALWLTVPGAGLTALLIEKLFKNPQRGYWRIPAWAIPLHAAATSALLVAIATNGALIARIVQEEAVDNNVTAKDIKIPYGFPVTDLNGIVIGPTKEARIGTLSTFTPTLQFVTRMYETDIYRDIETPERPRPFVVQLKRLDENIQPMLVVLAPNGETIAGPFVYPENSANGIVQKIQFPRFQTEQELSSYSFVVCQQRIPDEKSVRAGRESGIEPHLECEDGTQPFERGQFFIILFEEDVRDGIMGTAFADIELVTTPLQVTWKLLRYNTNPFSLPIIPFLMIIIVITFFLVGSVWGSRAAWRGIGLGFMLYFVVYGVGLGWQASYTYADDARELWQVEPTPRSHENLVETLREISLHNYGEPYALEIMIQGDDDTALAWALHDFHDITYTRYLPIDARPEVVIAPLSARPDLADEYVGQDFVRSTAWDYGSLEWTDFISWLTWRETRYKPVTDERIVLWIRKDIYKIERVPEN